MTDQTRSGDNKGPKRGQQTPAPKLEIVPAAHQEIPDVKQQDLDVWVKNLYTTQITEEELKAIYAVIAYKGFNRTDVLKQLTRLNIPTKTTIELIILCALQGPQRASKTPMSNGRTPMSYGIPASGGKGTKALNCNRISAATADLAAFYLKRLDAPKRLNLDLPGWLQFPSAGSIKMPDRYRSQHIEFQKKFSPQIGGEFNEQIYSQMLTNAYLDESLHLFD